MLTLLVVSEHRGELGVKLGGIIEQMSGISVHDGWSTYRKFEVLHALCNCHHIRELVAVNELDGEPWAGEMIALLLRMLRSVERAHAKNSTSLPKQTLTQYATKYDNLIRQARILHPPRPPGRRVKRPKAANLLDRLDIHREDILRFTHNFDVPFTNNQAERDLRMLKVKQNVSGEFRSPNGASDHAIIRSVISTALKQGQDVIDVLQRALAGNHWHPAT